ncbi:GTPase-associated system all-helical protein GASH [Hansschlegelia quercus]|uniref:GTPase-associated system helical domain-containing protein n=1 Tax=Hansschlegelia quercus TaxID=2528245 RepID=A0A4Q9GJW6_9HYPH|nr:GTPase-associated system all-helical protein GASH [Hansschlegelia quercus]TBN54452.1 hypothetical protein EYR15_06375 [Hansschlegelia quercus]
MSSIDFADRYALGGLQPTAEIINLRELSATRVQEDATDEQKLDLVGAYYGLRPDLTWFRDELRKEDLTFSLVTGEREAIIVAAAILGASVAAGDAVSILGLVAGSVQGKRSPTEAVGLVDEARLALKQRAVTNRIPQSIVTPIKHSATPKLAETIEVAADIPQVVAALSKTRGESQESDRVVAKQVTDAVSALNANFNYLREESQILWWLFGEHSRSSGKPFDSLRPAQAALLGGIELGELCTTSYLGPVAAPAVLERVLRSAKKDSKSISLALAVDGLSADLDTLSLEMPLRPGICPVLTALNKAREIGGGGWVQAFESATGLDAHMEFKASELAEQVFYEQLLESAL